MNINLVGEVISIQDDDNWQAVFIRQENVGCNYYTKGQWMEIYANQHAGSVDIELTGKGLRSGEYTLEIPYILAWGASKYKNAARDFRETWKLGNVGAQNFTGKFKINFKVKNKYNISGENIILVHHTMTPDEVNGNRIVGRDFSISCKTITSVSINLVPQRVDLGNGVTSLLHLRYLDK